ncbi:unnamed protein product [Rotaria sordida]|uniref:EF-hand domain-containing protein n=1 Tax=Rotaria sordida TaxID=392033 RepID=A0A814L242_9BILA|nr:unnamed protein product [Rotaria sordida]CAF3639969.1 unnamed protein product [Rotaria sordida]
MAENNATDALFQQIDTNRDGRIDPGELRDWVQGPDGGITYNEPINRYDDPTCRYDQYRYIDSGYPDECGYPSGRYSPYGTRRWVDDSAVITTNSPEETNAYLERSGSNIFRDPNPRIVRRARSASPVTAEQRVVIRYLQPPAVPPPGPLIIREVRSRPSSPLPPLVIHERSRPLPSPPPLILREQPPIPPRYVASETITRTVPGLPPPPRSVIIERYPAAPEKPRDIIIERWIPYGPQCERRTIVQPAPPVADCERPSNTIIIYSNVETRLARKFERLGVTPEDPASYRARFGSSLLDPITLVQEARNAGVVEDISPPVISSPIYTTPVREYPGYLDRPNEVTIRPYPSTVRNSAVECQQYV